MSRQLPAVEADPLTLIAATWLACGMVLYGLTPLPLRDAALGWSAAFWLLAAPVLLLVAKRVLLRNPLITARRKQPAPRRTRVQARRRTGTTASADHRRRNPSHQAAA